MNPVTMAHNKPASTKDDKFQIGMDSVLAPEKSERVVEDDSGAVLLAH